MWLDFAKTLAIAAITAATTITGGYFALKAQQETQLQHMSDLMRARPFDPANFTPPVVTTAVATAIGAPPTVPVVSPLSLSSSPLPAPAVTGALAASPAAARHAHPQGPAAPASAAPAAPPAAASPAAASAPSDLR
jgi:hypothetical protein